MYTINLTFIVGLVHAHSCIW